MPVDIEENCLVVYKGVIFDLENPIFILSGNSVALAYVPGQYNQAWYYDAQNDLIANRPETRIGFASQFISLTGLTNHSGSNMTVAGVTKEMVTFKAVPISGLNNLNVIEDEPSDI